MSDAMWYTEHMCIDPAYRARLRACGLDTVQRALDRIDGRVAAWSRSTDTLYVPGAEPLQPGFYVKRHFFRSWRKRLRGALRGTFFGMHRGQAEYLALNSMRDVGVPAVRAVAYGTRRVAHFLAACFLITEEVPGARNLTSFALDDATGPHRMPQSQRNDWIDGLADSLAHMHATGCSHGNLFFRNILVRPCPSGRPEFFFLDAQPLRPWERFGTPGVSWWIRELAQVTVSALPFTRRSERLRFLRRYLRGATSSESLRLQLQQIERLAEQWRRHEDRRIRLGGLFDRWNAQLSAELGATSPPQLHAEPVR